MDEQHTQFFYQITPEVVLRAVEEFGVRCTGRCLSLHSMENRVYDVEIELPSSTELKKPSDKFRVVKFYRPGRWSKEQILEEHEFLFDLIDAEVEVVAPLRDKAGNSLRSIENTIWYAVFPKQGGRSPQELKDDELERVGRLLARLHTVGAGKVAKHRLRLTPETYGVNNLRFLVDSGTIPPDYREPYSRLAGTIITMITPWFEGVPAIRVHGDAHLGNLLWGNEGPFWVDFDDMLVAPPVQDLWLVMLERGEEARKRQELLLSGYESIRNFDRSTLSLIEALRTLRMINYTAWIAKRFDDPAFKLTFPQFGTLGYWREQLGDLQEQSERLQGAL